ncbi:SPOR domain-containing protein [bacterium SCSIO 12741]|nr:SPOR domain-containing protein [bacterium SCSIO 12741]
MRTGLLSLLLFSFLALNASVERPTCDLYEAELEVFNDQVKSLYKSSYDALELAKRSQNEKSEALNEKVTRVLTEARKHADLAANSINQLKLHKECACANFDFSKIENGLIEIRFHIKKAMNVDLKKKKQSAYESRTANAQVALDKASDLQVYLLDPCSSPIEEAAPVDTTTEPEPVVVAADTTPTPPPGPELVIDEPDTASQPGPELVQEEEPENSGPELVEEEEPEPSSSEGSNISTPAVAGGTVLAAGAVVAGASENENEETEEAASEPQLAEEEEPEPETVEPEPAPTPIKETPPAPPVQVQTGPEPPVYFALQIAASGSDKESQRYADLGHEVYVVPEGGLYKYRIGKYPDFNQVVAVKNELFEKGLTDAFIVAYADGQKVSVAEARSKSAGTSTANTTSTTPTSSPYKDVKLKKKSNVFVSVQLGANVTQVDPILEIVKYENIIQREVKVLRGSPIRYYTGEFTNPKDAESLLNVIKLSGIPDAFLVGIADGERIEYQKAVEFLNSNQ